MNYGLAFLAGLLGSGHCLGMCGGLVSGCFLKLGPAARRPAAHTAYHGARVAVYAAVGAVAGGFGEALTQSGRFGLAQGVLQIVAGIVVIVLGLDILGFSPLPVTVGFAPASFTRRLFSRAVGAPAEPGGAPPASPIGGMLLAGVANGLMPCALTLAIAVQATTTKSAAAGALLMAAFGAGTLPSMVAVGLLFGRLSATTRDLLLKAAALLVIAMGAWQLWLGLTYVRVMGKLVL
ncbi:MAG TPA: sulfite exporter TauE/SafE family protein [Thermoanaerobaculia bacterium]|nr:sulfite exporter TauE/SafE family protein [Thermoanaerobaculia bacterium]